MWLRNVASFSIVSIVYVTAETSYSINYLCPRNLMTTSWRPRSRVGSEKQHSFESVAKLLQRQWSWLQLRRQTVPAHRSGYGKAAWTIAGSSGSWSQKVVTGCWPLKVKVKVNVDLYSASSWEPHLYKGLRCGSQFYLQTHHTCL